MRRSHCGELDEQFQYRDFITVALMVRATDVFPDNWIYLQEPGIIRGQSAKLRELEPGDDPRTGRDMPWR